MTLVAEEQFERRFQGHDPAAGTDTGGTPWAGRQLTSTGFDGDTGTADPALLAALSEAQAALTTAHASLTTAHASLATAHGAAKAPGQVPADDAGHPEAGVDRADPVERLEEAETRMIELVASARLLVPVVALAGETTEVNGLVSDATSDMAAVTLQAPDGQRALPAFTSLAALADWDSTARPVPVTAQRAAQAAVQEGCHEVVLDIGAPSYAVLRGSMVWALAMGRPWVPPRRDAQVKQAVQAALVDEVAVAGFTLATGPAGALQINLELQPGLAAAHVQELAQRLGERIALDGEVRARIDALAFTVSAAR